MAEAVDRAEACAIVKDGAVVFRCEACFEFWGVAVDEVRGGVGVDGVVAA